MSETFNLFTGSNCSACATLKTRLEALGISKDDYTECDTAEDRHKDSILALGYRSIPVLVKYVDGEVVDSINGSMHSDSELFDFFTWGLVGPFGEVE